MSFSVIIPSKKSTNLVSCVSALRQCEPELDPQKIIVVNDGARSGAAGRLPGVRWIEGVKPFVFARNINRGIVAAGDDDVILLNDDALLTTPGGFSEMAATGRAAGMGIVSAVTNCAGNLAQYPRTSAAALRDEPRVVVFVCVWIARATINMVGLLDERFIAYGYDDNDYCRRVRDAGQRIGIFDGCFVDHMKLNSTFRGAPGAGGDTTPGRKIYEGKWGRGAQ